MILLELCSDLDLLNQASHNHGVGGATAANLDCLQFFLCIVCFNDRHQIGHLAHCFS